MAKAIARNHHYVCDFLLKNFADESGTLWIYDSKLGTCRDGNTRSAAFERDLYSLTLVRKGPDYATLEAALERQIDSPGALAVQKLLNHEQCDHSEWLNFLGFVAAQMVRTPAYFDRLRAMEGPVLQEMLERMAKFDPEFREGLREEMMKQGAADDEVERQLQAAANGRYKVRPTHAWIVANAMQGVSTIHSELREMHWTFLTVPDGEPELLIGDCPVMLTEPGPEKEHPRPLGLRNSNIELVMPLSRRMVVVARRDGPDSFGELVKGSAGVVNVRTLSYARRFVFASYQSDTLLSEVVERRGTGPKLRLRRIQMGEQLAIVSEYR